MNILNDGDLELDGYPIGKAWEVFAENLDPGFPAVRHQDSDTPHGDGRRFGRDYLGGPTWSMDLVVNQYTAADARRVAGELARRWRANRSTPGAESVLRYNIGGETRLVYGRPRNFAPDPAGINSGVITATATFDCTDHLAYGDQQRTVQVQLVPDPTGGFTVPFTAPLVIGTTAERQGTIPDVGGTEPAPFEATIYGPVSNPYLAGNGWRIELQTSIAHDDWIIVDTRRATALRRNGASARGTMSRFTRLTEARLLPGADLVRFGGIDATGTARAVVAWRPTFDGL